MRQILTVNKFSALENETSCCSDIGCWSYLIVLTFGRNGRRWSVQAKCESCVFGSDSACAVKILLMFVDKVHSLQTKTRVLLVLYVPVSRTLIRHTWILLKDQQARECMNLILLPRNHRYVSPDHLAIFRVVRTRMQFQLCVGISSQLKIMYFW
jgi:hypothetical protein